MRTHRGQALREGREGNSGKLGLGISSPTHPATANFASKPFCLRFSFCHHIICKVQRSFFPLSILRFIGMCFVFFFF